ncbi:hypothetical protein AXX00_21130 [Pseudomonas aeruginosa]|nr:hypothetical protein AXX00_21130 [Pseudomonas aeruginosa]
MFQNFISELRQGGVICISAGEAKVIGMTLIFLKQLLSREYTTIKRTTEHYINRFDSRIRRENHDQIVQI